MPASPTGATVTIVSTNQTVVGDANNGTLVSNHTSAGKVINSTTQVPGSTWQAAFGIRRTLSSIELNISYDPHRYAPYSCWRQSEMNRHLFQVTARLRHRCRSAASHPARDCKQTIINARFAARRSHRCRCQ